jgi:dUTPase
VFNLGNETTEIRAGDRIAQLVLHNNLAPKYRPAPVESGLFDRIPGDGRGEAGFGSSGS